jgi:hypothetical protein
MCSAVHLPVLEGAGVEFEAQGKEVAAPSHVTIASQGNRENGMYDLNALRMFSQLTSEVVPSVLY